VRHGLTRAFSGIQFTLVEQEPPGMAQVRLPPFLRLWLAVFGARIRYPHYAAAFETGTGLAIEFYFQAESPVRRIRMTLYGQTTQADKYFDDLESGSGWEVRHLERLHDVLAWRDV
jgi:hypothetical protein